MKEVRLWFDNLVRCLIESFKVAYKLESRKKEKTCSINLVTKGEVKMKFKKFFKGFTLSILLVSFAIPFLVQADTYIKQKRHTDAYEIMGQTQPEKDEITMTWMSNDKGRIDQGEDKSTIIRLDKNIMYFLDHNKKVYNEMPIGELGEILSSAIPESELPEEERAKAEEFMKGITEALMQAEAKVTETGEKKKIKRWNCRKYVMKMKMM